MRKTLLCIFVGILAATGPACQQPVLPAESVASADWSVYQGPGSNQATTLSAFTKENISTLSVFWEYRSGDATQNSQIQCNSLIINGKAYASTPQLDVVCLDAGTGTEIWRASPSQYLIEDEIPSSWMGVNRGLVYAKSPEEDRIFISHGPYLFAFSAQNGALLTSFGTNGRIDLRMNLRENAQDAFVVANSPGVVFGENIIIGCRVSESTGAAPGDIRAFNIHSGELVWRFHTIPHTGEEGEDTWPQNAYLTAGGANAWAGMTMDDERGIVFIPTGSASYDFYGADRPGDNLYANCLLALDASTGKKLWHYQFVHHDVLDRDLPAPPNLVTFTHQGKQVEAVAQITKTGHIFVFDRETGEPIFWLEEISVPSSDMPGEVTSPTQPMTTLPPFSRQSVTTVNPFAAGKDSLQTILDELRKGSIFEPPSIEGTLVFPGYDGGGEWGGAAFDPWRGLMIVNSSQMAWTLNMIPAQSDHPGNNVYLVNCASCHGADLQGGEFMGTIPSLTTLKDNLNRQEIAEILNNGKGTMPSFASIDSVEKEAVIAFLLGEKPPQIGTGNSSVSYVSSGYNRFLDKKGYPAINPPWGLLTAIDLNTGEVRWKIPLGEYEELSDLGYPITGTENYGGPLVTANGITFIAATKDEKIRAFDSETGELLWEDQLPAGGYATPSMYETGGKQFLLIACGGGKMGTKSGDYYVAYSLP